MMLMMIHTFSYSVNVNQQTLDSGFQEAPYATDKALMIHGPTHC
jgi:hypothetical protein